MLFIDEPNLNKVIEISNYSKDSNARRWGWKLLHSMLQSRGFRWEYFN